MKQLSVRFEDDFHKEIKHYCVEHEVTINELVNQLLKEKLEKEKEKK